MRLAVPSALETREITQLEELVALVPEWSELWTRCPDATPFQSPAWLVSWWKHLGSGDLRVLVLRQEGRLAGVAPFCINRESLPPNQRLLLVGTGVSDYLDVLLDPGIQEPALGEIFAYLDRTRRNWDICDFQELSDRAALRTAPAPFGWSDEIAVQQACPVLCLPQSPADLDRVVPADMLKRLNYYRRRLRRMGAVSLETVRPDNFGELFESLVESHRARWNARRQEGVLASESLRRFHREAAQGFLAAGSLRFFGLRVNGRIQASLYGFAHGRRAYFYLSGFDPAAIKAVSPGILLIGHALEAAVREGATEFDFLRGREPYKYRWGAQDRLNCRRTLSISHHETP